MMQNISERECVSADPGLTRTPGKVRVQGNFKVGSRTQNRTGVNVLKSFPLAADSFLLAHSLARSC